MNLKIGHQRFDLKRFDTGLNIPFLLFSVLLYFICVFFQSNYPYYFMWDMDHTVTLDLVGLHSNHIPTHINHPSFGLYFILYHYQNLLISFGIITSWSVNDFYQAINPLFPLYKLTEVNRWFSPFLVLTICFLIADIFRKKSRTTNKQINFLFLIFAFTQVGLFYHSALIRTELYSIFFLVLAFWTLQRDNNFSGFISGIFLGLALLTKIQSIFLIIILIFYNILSRNSGKVAFQNKRKIQLLSFSLHLVALAIFLFLTGISLNKKIPMGFATFASESQFTYNKFFFLFLTYIIASVLFSFLLIVLPTSRFVKLKYSYSLMSLKNSFLALGILISFLFHFFIGLDFGTSFDYLLYDFRIVFLRETYNGLSLSSQISTFFDRDIFREFYVEMICNLALSFLVLLNSNPKRRLLDIILVGTLDLILMLHFCVGTRDIYRDYIWVDLPLNIIIFLKAIYLFRYKFPFRLLAGLVLLTCFMSNFNRIRHAIVILDSEFNFYGWNSERLMNPVYGDHWGYGKLINSKFPDKDNKFRMTTKATEIGKLMRTACFVVASLKCDDKNISVLFMGGPSTLGDQSTFGPPPKNLENAIIYKLPHSSDDVLLNLKEGLTLSEVDVSGKIEKETFDRISILGRYDLEVYFFSQNRSNTAEEGPKISTLKNKETVLFFGELLNKRNNINLFEINYGDFLLIKNRF